MVGILEKSVEKTFVTKMSDSGWENAKMDLVRPGWSDRFFFGFGARVVIVEFKREGARPNRRGEARQDYYREEFRRRGFECHKVETVEQARALQQKLCEENEHAEAKAESSRHGDRR